MKKPTLATMSLGLVLASAAFAASAQDRKPYLVQLADAPIASYEGGVSGLTATKPGPGQRLEMASQRVQAYGAYLATKVNTITAKVPAANVYHRYGVVVNGFAAMLTADELNALRLDPAVKAITADEGVALDTSYTTSQFMKLAAANGAWARKDTNGKDLKGEGVIIAMVDSGVWPENVSVSDKVGVDGKPVPYHAAGTVVYDPLPAGRYRGTCQAGEGFTSAMCNNKLIGAQVFNTTFLQVQTLANVWPGEYLSPRDEDGHGTHTLTTAGGNANSKISVGGADFETSGVAPRARLAAYKACNTYTERPSGLRRNTCYNGDTVAAIDKAVADGVDVINFSIGGSATAINGVVAQAMLGAAKANVFVSASAGNSGPGQTTNPITPVAHVSPWIATVGNSTHDRYTEAVVTLGSTTAQGASWQTAGLPNAPVILSINAGVNAFASLSAADKLALSRCYINGDAGYSPNAALDPAKTAGKIVVCYRGGNVLVNKAAAAKAAGAAGMILQNVTAAQAVDGVASSNTVLSLAHVLPTVHVPSSFAAAVVAWATPGTNVASFGGAFQVAGVVAPIMAGSSQRGPNAFDNNVLKPDLTGPGTDILAGYTAANVSADERAAIIAGTAIARQGADLLSGTSMSSPHVAGSAALVRQANPSWSPAAVKSALMTSAAQIVKLSSGAVDTGVGAPTATSLNTGPFGYGAGHVWPNEAVTTTVVYDISNAQYDAYFARTLSGLNLNLPSITFSNILGAGTTTRTLKNTGTSAVTLTAAPALAGFDVVVTPATLTIAPGASASYSVRVARTTAPFASYVYGNLTWSGSGQTLRSPLTARAVSVVAYNAIEDTRVNGVRLFTIGTGFSGPMGISTVGMVPATRSSGSVAKGAQTCFPITVPAGAVALRAQLFNSDTQGGAASDLDMTVYRGTTVVGTSGASDSNELVQLTNPTAATNYQVCVEGYEPLGGTANFTLSTWVVGPAVGTQTLKASGPSVAYLGGTASVAASWTTTAGVRSFGVVQYRETANGPVVGGTTVFVDASGAQPATTEAPVLRSKSPF
jgi:subtilisin family serine protease